MKRPYIPPNAKKWLRALRSGKYKQTVGNLHSKYGEDGYCCLGVACELAVKAGVNIKVTEHGGIVFYNRKSDFLPPIVRKWLGFGPRNEAGMFKRKDSYTYDSYETLASLNDSRFTFSEIADIVEQNADQLFKHPKQ